MNVHWQKPYRFQRTMSTRLLSTVGLATALGLSGCNGLDSLNQKSITGTLPSGTSSSSQLSPPSGTPTQIPSPVPSAKPSATPTPTATPSPSASPAPMPTTSPVAVNGVTPSWLAGKSLNTWIEIPNTSGAGGAAIDAWGSLTLRDDTSELFILAAGGHSDSSDNRVVSIKLTDNAPQWILRSAPTPANMLTPDTSHYADGKPASRHIYQDNHWVPDVHRLMMVGLHFGWPNAYQFPTIDGFNPDTNTWDPPGTWPDLPAGAGFGIHVEKKTSAVWTNGMMLWDPITKLFSSPISHSSGDMIRYPMSEDTLRNQLFSLQIGDGQGYGLNAGIQASRIPLNGDTQYHVTFNPSAALSQFIADSPTYSAMDYDPANDQFLYYCGQGNGAGRIYVIKPNATNTWDMSILPLASGSPIPPSIAGNGVNGRFMYVPSLKGFALLPNGTSNFWFIRTSN